MMHTRRMRPELDRMLDGYRDARRFLLVILAVVLAAAGIVEIASKGEALVRAAPANVAPVEHVLPAASVSPERRAVPRAASSTGVNLPAEERPG
jgi:hypothetical protein